MIITFILALVAFIYFLVIFWQDEEYLNGLVIGLVTGFLTFILCLLVTSCLNALVPEEQREYEVETVQIAALCDNVEVNGKIFLGTGTVKNDLYYYYLKETENGYKMGKLQAENVEVRYTNDAPHIETYNWTGYKKWYYYIFATPAFDFSRNIIYVPEGSIQTSFNIDLI